MSDRRAKLAKLQRLASSSNEHEAALARALAADLGKNMPAEVPRPARDPAFPDQLPGARRVPTPLERGGR